MSRLVSVIVTTRNNRETLAACLASIKKQTYQPIELIVADNNSRDGTLEIARRYTDRVYTKGPERSAQRNFAVARSSGQYVLIVDSDMVLGDEVVSACVREVEGHPGMEALIIPEESFGTGFWAACKQLERSFYVGQDSIEAARFFSRSLYDKTGGYAETMTGGEDWDLTRRVRQSTVVGRARALIRHDEGRLYFGKTIRKFYYYAQQAPEFSAGNPAGSLLTHQSGPLARYALFFSRPGRLCRNPLLSFGMLVLKTAEYVGAACGLLKARLKIRREAADGDS